MTIPYDRAAPNGQPGGNDVLARFRRFQEHPLTPLIIGAIAFAVGVTATVLRIVAVDLSSLARDGIDLRINAVIAGAFAALSAGVGMRSDRSAGRRGARSRTIGLVLGLLGALLGIALIVVGIFGWALSL